MPTETPTLPADNPFSQPSPLPYGTPPFDRIADTCLVDFVRERGYRNPRGGAEQQENSLD